MSRQSQTHLLYSGVNIEVDEGAELSLSPEVQFRIAALLVDPEFELDLAVVRVGELLDGDHVLCDLGELLPCCLRHFWQDEDDKRMRRLCLVDAVNQHSQCRQLLRARRVSGSAPGIF